MKEIQNPYFKQVRIFFIFDKIFHRPMNKLLLILLTPFTLFAQQFIEKEVVFYNKKDAISLSGTILIPQKIKNPKVAILLSGTGQSDRDQTIFGHKPFKTIAEHLAKNGIAVLRYDDRGGGKSTGKTTVNSTTLELSEDAEAAFHYIKSFPEFEKSKIGFIGHSEGGIIAPMVAARNKNIAFLISLAGPAIPIKNLMSQQNYDILVGSKIDSTVAQLYISSFYLPAIEIILSNQADTLIKQKIISLTDDMKKTLPSNSQQLLFGSSEFIATTFIRQMQNPFMRYFFTIDPAIYWKKVNCQTLAIFGGLDLQVNPIVNQKALKKINPNIETMLLPAHNHLFQEAKTGTLQEYGQIKHAISESTLNLLSDWILKLK